METGREEFKFKSHYIGDLEQVVRREIEHSASLTNDMQVCLAKLHTAYCLPCVCAGGIAKVSKRGGKKHPTESRGEGGKEWQTKHTNTHTIAV